MINTTDKKINNTCFVSQNEKIGDENLENQLSIILNLFFIIFL